MTLLPFINENITMCPPPAIYQDGKATVIPRYIYTEKGDIIDLQHVFQSAYMASQVGNSMARNLGDGLELQQLVEGRFSGYAIDDLRSNELGRILIGEAGNFIDIRKALEFAMVRLLGGDEPAMESNEDLNAMDFRGRIISAFESLGATSPSNYPYWNDLPVRMLKRSPRDNDWDWTSPDTRKGFITIGNFDNVWEDGSFCC